MYRRHVILIAAAVAAATPAVAQQRPPGWNPTDSIRQLASYRPAADTMTLLAPARIARLVPGDSARWAAYRRRGRETRARDTASMNAELRRVGRDTMSRAPYARAFGLESRMTPAWLASDSARRIAESILSYQAPNGGWSKHVDYAQGPRAPGQSYYAEHNRWAWISTFDNSSTTEQMRFLARADAARPDDRYRAAYLRGLDYLLAAQMPNGCWPQSWPLEGSYHDAVTFNDGVMANVLRVLRETGDGRAAFVPTAGRDLARAAAERGLECLLATQVLVRDTLTAWGQQHDPLTLRPTSARSYELTSLTAQESAGIVRYLMRVKAPSARVVAAVHAAADWYRDTAIRDRVYEGYELREQAGAGPIWARMYEIGTNRPIFSNRDGITLYEFDRLTDRRRGYGWFTTEPAEVLAEYETWARAHPRATKVAK